MRKFKCTALTACVALFLSGCPVEDTEAEIARQTQLRRNLQAEQQKRENRQKTRKQHSRTAAQHPLFKQQLPRDQIQKTSAAVNDGNMHLPNLNMSTLLPTRLSFFFGLVIGENSPPPRKHLGNFSPILFQIFPRKLFFP